MSCSNITLNTVKQETGVSVEKLNQVISENTKLSEMLTVLCEKYNDLHKKYLDLKTIKNNPENNYDLITNSRKRKFDTEDYNNNNNMIGFNGQSTGSSNSGLTMDLSNFEIPKTLSECDVTEKGWLPVKIMEHMGEHSVKLTAFDRWGQQWSLKYYTRPNKNRRKPVFTFGWRQLVTANGVLPGDEFIFSRHQYAGGMPHYMIRVKRKTKTEEGETVNVEVMKRLSTHDRG